MVATKGETTRGWDEQKVHMYCMEKNVLSAQKLEMSLVGVGAVLRLERNAWSMVKMTKASNE